MKAISVRQPWAWGIIYESENQKAITKIGCLQKF